MALLPMQRVGASGERLLRFLVGVASLGGFLFGYDTGVVSGAMIKIVKRFDLNPFEHEVRRKGRGGEASSEEVGSGLTTGGGGEGGLGG